MKTTLHKPKRAPPQTHYGSRFTFHVNYPFILNEGDSQWQQPI
jgi:hypothetical protein